MRRVAGYFGVAALLVGCTSEPETNIFLPAQNNGGTGGDGGSSSADTTTSTSTGQDPEANAHDYFVQSLYPSLDDTCGACHVGGPGTVFLAEDGEGSYTKIKTYSSIVTATPMDSRLITKGEHSSGDAPALTQDQQDMVVLWLTKELEEDPDPEPEPEPELTPLQELEAFGKCISLADWEATGVYLLAEQEALDGNNTKECNACHVNGASGTFIDLNSQLMYEATQKMPYIMKFAVATMKEDGTFNDIVKANRWIEKGVEDCPLGNCHPTFTLDQTVADAINALFAATYTRWQSGDCTEVADGGAGGGGGNP